MRDIQKGCLPRLVVVGLWCLLGGVTCLASDLPDGNNRQRLNIASVVGDQATGVEPLWTSESRTNVTTDLKPEHHAKETEAKTLTDAKKKLAVDAKVKPEQKYQKFKDDDSVKKFETATPTFSTISVTTDLPPKTTLKSVTLTTTLAPMVTDPVTTKEMINEAVDNPRNESSKTIPPSAIPATNSSLSQQEVAMEKVGPNVTMVQDAATSRGRALNVSAPEPTNSLYANITDLSDVSMDDEDNDEKSGQDGEYSTSARTTVTPMVSTSQLAIQNCIEGNRTYTPGEKIIRGCDEKCICGKNGRASDCRQLCTSPYVRAGRGVHDPLCEEKVIAEEPCCAVLICTADSAPEPEESCVFGNKTVPRGQRVEDGCAKICICEAGGHLKCQPRCPPNETAPSAVNQHDRCVVLADPRDACCTITLCDVTLGEHEIKLENSVGLTVNLTDAKVLNSTAIKLKLSAKKPELVTIEISDDNHVWRQLHTDKEGIVSNLEPAHTYYVRVTEMGQGGPALSVQLPAEVIKTNIPEKSPSRDSCAYRGKFHEVGAEWYDECISFCSCLPGGKAECATIECPTDFGLDVLDPHCLDWETVPPNFVPKAPRCCPQEVRCRNNGSCLYEGKTYKNWSQLPLNVTGCEKRCYCEMGKVSCQAECPPVPALPPPNLPCPAYRASLTHIAGDDCCLHWVCAGASSLPPRAQVPGMDHHNLHPGFALPGTVPGFQIGNPSDEVTIHVLQALDENTVRLVFTVPQVLVGLHGRVELRYTSDKANYDPSTWKTQVFAPPDDLIATPQLEFELGDLKPGTDYKVKVTMKLKDLANSPSSKIYNVSTLERHADLTTLPPQISIDAELLATETNTTWINVRWKKFTQNELQFIDGVQLRYKENDAKVYAGTPLIHRTVTNYIIDNLKPATSYLIGIYLIPFVGQTTELISENSIRVTTSLDPDPYSFDVKVDVKTIKSTSVEIYWGGVPYPQDKYVNIYRAIYQSDSGKEDSSTFKLANKDTPPKTIISDLKPGTRYRLWSEVYLTNGKIKKTNVQDFVTKPGIVPLQGAVSQQGKLASLPTLPEGDYYGPLVIVAIVASLAILSTLILLMMLMKRRTSSKADISPRKTTSAYDNPSYKVELQQETMDL